MKALVTTLMISRKVQKGRTMMILGTSTMASKRRKNPLLSILFLLHLSLHPCLFPCLTTRTLIHWKRFFPEANRTYQRCFPNQNPRNQWSPLPPTSHQSSSQNGVSHYGPNSSPLLLLRHQTGSDREYDACSWCHSVSQSISTRYCRPRNRRSSSYLASTYLASDHLDLPWILAATH